MSGTAPTERRSRLRQYQVQLLERMQAAKSGATESGRELGVLIGGRPCLLDLTQISEIVPPQPVTPVPLTHDWYLGLANIRGHLTGVIDLARYRQQAPGDAAPSERRLITFAPGLGFNCALRVERVLGLRKLAGMEAVAGDEFRDGEGQSWLRLDLAQLVREPRFVQVGLV
ncbi:twitching motility protein PilI [Duganella sp. SG902]|uniref:chemotaxis protein CheW n=1 Tax=Duganella sp. SG902 TaxID=2587016 RepID=UPI00159D9993|nr:chemotaxis protein CheW [Duganella sp. SG902]NVM74973.1 twitching motility protein PilI [Duganella sp. SG902]